MGDGDTAVKYPKSIFHLRRILQNLAGIVGQQSQSEPRTHARVSHSTWIVVTAVIGLELLEHNK